MYAMAGLAGAAKPIIAETPGLGTSAWYLPMKHHHVLMMVAQPVRCLELVNNKFFLTWVNGILLNYIPCVTSPWGLVLGFLFKNVTCYHYAYYAHHSTFINF